MYLGNCFIEFFGGVDNSLVVGFYKENNNVLANIGGFKHVVKHVSNSLLILEGGEEFPILGWYEIPRIKDIIKIIPSNFISIPTFKLGKGTFNHFVFESVNDFEYTFTICNESRIIVDKQVECLQKS